MSAAARIPQTESSGSGAEPVAVSEKRRRWIPIAGVFLLATAGTAAWVAFGGADDGAAASSAPPDFEAVVVMDMTRVETLAGTLGFELGEPVVSRVAGTLTRAVEPGEVLGEGDVLFEVDERPVVLLYGGVPAYRTMSLAPDSEDLAVRAAGTVTWSPATGADLGHGDVIVEIDGEPVVALIGEIPMYRTIQYGRTPTVGPDVRQLEESLVALGFDPDGRVEVDETFDWNTHEMVLEWQEAVGAPPDGAVGVHEVVYLLEPVTVGDLRVAVGDQVQGSGVIATVHAGFTGTEGSDVAQLEAALERLGYAPGAVDGRFSSDTRLAVERWQADAGAEPDGAVDLGEVVFLPGPVRVAEATLALGDEVRSGSPVFASTSDSVAVSVDLDAADQELLTEGLDVVVVLPSDVEVAGVVTSVASVARRNQQTGATTFDVRIELEDVSAAAGLDEAPVDVEIVTDSRPGVMAVPVTALLALAEGGYAVEVDAGGGATRLVAVDTGIYADGFVEVDADGLAPGDRVVAP